MLRAVPWDRPAYRTNKIIQPAVELRLSLVTGDVQGTIWTGTAPRQRGGYTKEELAEAASDGRNPYSLMFLRAAFHKKLPAVKLLEGECDPVKLPLQPKLTTIDTKTLVPAERASPWPDALHEQFIDPIYSGRQLGDPKDWQFACLSHVWGRQLKRWSRTAVAMIGVGNNDCSLPDYGRAVAEASKLPEFVFVLSRLMKVLRAVVLHGHRFLWMDTVCINQASREEVDAELSYMASFFLCSQCTFVLLRGLEGDMKLDSAEHDVPRWFLRVWTLQESLLPRNLRILIEADYGVEVRRLVERSQTLGCASMYEGLLRWSELATIDDIATVNTASSPAQWCKMHPKRLIHEREDVLYIQESRITEYSEEILCKLVAVNPQMVALLLQEKLKLLHASRKWFEFLKIMEYYEKVLVFLVTRRTEASWDPVGILQEIQRRSCTFEEDRIISILGVLVATGQQVRVGRSLNEQT